MILYLNADYNVENTSVLFTVIFVFIYVKFLSINVIFPLKCDFCYLEGIIT